MPEHQRAEYKQKWHDEYLKWICGYANAYGGTLSIGLYDDGTVKGIDNTKKLLEDLPNKITSTMGIIADVNLCVENDLSYIEIIVENYPSMISYQGKYYYRAGSTMREINGKELDEKLLKSQGKTWDGIPIPKVKIIDLNQGSIDVFKKKAIERGRLSRNEVSVNNQILLENLHLLDDNGNLIRAAVLAFYNDPEKWVAGAYIKIGFFGKSDADLLYQDEVHGPLIEQADKVVNLVYTKYLKARIAYQGIQRVEQFMLHQDAFREILLNVIVHKDYSGCVPIQISVYEDKIYIWNDGKMPANLSSSEKLFMNYHQSLTNLG